MPDEKEFTLDEIKNIHGFIKKSEFYKIYEEFSWPCDKYVWDGNESCFQKVEENLEYSSEVNKILKVMYSILYRIYAKLSGSDNTYFEHIKNEDSKFFYTSLKYWLYDQMIIKGLYDRKFDEIVKGLEEKIKHKIKRSPPKNPCVFNKLTLDEIKRLKNIYALYTVLYDNNDNFESCNDNKCKYLEYFGKGLDEIINSINSCSNNSNQTNYCKEFNEFVDLCKEDNVYAGISIYDEKTKSNAETAKKYFLFSEIYKEEQLYIYVKNDKLLNFIKTSNFLSNKSTTIAATSVVGSAIGLSSIFYYFYKVIYNDIFKHKYYTIIYIKYFSKNLL
ncbi:hypothetical protein PVBG_06117 [Plasmodium vivax Brazil I]|uniref:Variable surface protein Vir21 n=1 Tax=Plasmodium vivax (strain Brazil I) TaxID=1033975 RepID=A0A0J9SXU7_PLAV1|nr:hypothetical protein PVBG_06117 [Plasmodium vivax Brazil I]